MIEICKNIAINSFWVFSAIVMVGLWIVIAMAIIGGVIDLLSHKERED